MGIMLEATVEMGFMEYFEAVLGLLAGLGAFLLGFKLLGDNMEKIAGNKLKQIFNKTSNKRLVNVGMGAAATAVVQSSTVTTVMVVGFVNAGIMTLYQAAAVIMGANIGTTLTAHIVALGAFDVAAFAMVLTAVGAIMIMIGKKDRIKAFGYALAGLGLIFMGLSFMSTSMSEFSKSQAFKDILSAVTNPILLLIIGIVMTAILQSSTAVTSILIVMASSGLIIGGNAPNAVLFVIMGTNIGTCLTAFLSSIGASTNAKRAAMLHLLFNTFGSVIFTGVIMLWPSFTDNMLASWLPLPGTQIAMFHTIFNTICTLIFLPFTKYLVTLTKVILPDKKTDKKGDMTFMDKRFLRTPALAIGQLLKEVYLMGDMAMLSLEMAYESFKNKDAGKIEKVNENNAKIQALSREIIDFLIQISASDISLSDEKLVNALHNNVYDVVRISELAENITKYTQQTVTDNLAFTEVVYAEVTEMHELIKEQYETTKRIILDREYSLLREADRREDKIDNMRRTFVSEHIERLNKGECRPESNGVFINLMANIERIGDHISFMAHSMDMV